MIERIYGIERYPKSKYWLRIIEILSSYTLEELLALDKEYYGYVEHVDDPILVRRSERQMQKDLRLGKKGLYVLSRHIRMGKYNMKTHIEKMKHDKYRDFFPKHQVI